MTKEVLEKFKEISDRIPDKEPANAGPSHQQFFSDIQAVTDQISKEDDPFPDPEITAAGYQTKPTV
jgi:hypothetical protein